jgi:hypothetical protein
MKSSTLVWTRRRVLRGMLAGGAVTVGLPIFDCLLNDNGTAFADTGAPLPTRFATWFWALGLGEEDWRPKNAGSDYELPPQLAVLNPFKKKLNLFSGSQVFLDGQSNNTHFTGVQGYMTGKVSNSGEYFNSINTLIGDVIAGPTRFRSLEVACDGDPKATWTARASGKLPAEISPTALYTRVFGPEFTDPNAATFVPDAKVMVRRSALSAVSEQRDALVKQLGASDRQRLDYYFTALRSLEQKLDIQLQKPEPLPACTKPDDKFKDDGHTLSLATEAMERHDLFTAILTHALACGQTRSVNLSITQGMSGLRREGDPTNHHTYTHEEPVDSKAGYQLHCAWFQEQYMKALYSWATQLDAIKEGDRTLLDRSVLFAYTDHGAARLHSVHNYPFITIGSGNGRVKTGLHVPKPGDAASRVTFTLMQAMGVPVSSFGSGSNHVAAPISEVIA